TPQLIYLLGHCFLGIGEIKIFEYHDAHSSAAPARRPTRIAFEAGAVADQGEVAAFGAAVAFVALDAGGADALAAEIPLRHRREGEGAVDVGGAAGAAVEHGQFVAHEAI